jgi:hypothetical protein
MAPEGGAEGLVNVVGTSSPDVNFPRRFDIWLVNSSPSFSCRRSAELLLKQSPCSTKPWKIILMVHNVSEFQLEKILLTLYTINTSKR